jgi:hypothetical protein
MVGIAVLALGTGPLFGLGTGLVVGSGPPERAGSAASMSETANYLGGALGMALLGALGAAVYRGHMAHAVTARCAGRRGPDDLRRDHRQWGLGPVASAMLSHRLGVGDRLGQNARP